MKTPLLNAARTTFIGGLAAAAFAAAAPSQAATLRADALGEPLPHATTSDRIVDVTPQTRWVNVQYGETVRFVVPSGEEVVWRFDGLANNLRLSEIADQQLARDVTIYVDQRNNPIRRETESG